MMSVKLERPVGPAEQPPQAGRDCDGGIRLGFDEISQAGLQRRSPVGGRARQFRAGVPRLSVKILSRTAHAVSGTPSLRRGVAGDAAEFFLNLSAEIFRSAGNSVFVHVFLL